MRHPIITIAQRALSVLAMVLGAEACTTYRPAMHEALTPQRHVRVTFSPARVIDFETSTGARESREVSRLEGVVTTVRGDTAWVRPEETWDARGKRIVKLFPPQAVAVLGRDDRSVIAARRVSAGRTVGLIAGIGTAGFLALVILWAATFPD